MHISVNKPYKISVISYNQSMRAFLFIWQLPQNILGFILSRGCEKAVSGGVAYYRWKGPGSISLGDFIIVSSPSVLPHELGHRKQSMMLGPLYLLVIGLPSLIWCILHTYTSLNRLDYYSFYTEAWAEHNASKTRNKQKGYR